MLARSLVFMLITFGLTMAVAFFVAAIVKVIAIVVQRGKGSSAPSSPKQ